MDGAGTISGRWALAAGRAAIKGCRICHGPTLPGMRLCTPCKAALKRARQETVSELVPPRNRTAVRTAKRSRATPATAPVAAGSRARVWRAVALVLLATAAVAVGFGALRLAHPGSSVLPPHPEPAVALQPADSVAVAPARLEPAAPATARGDTRPSGAATAPKSEVRSAARPARERPAQKRVVEPPPAPGPPQVARFAAATEPPVPQPAAAEPIAVAKPAPAPDRWQLMAAAIAQCGREGFLAGVICEQRVRLRYCEGHWGQAPQCTSGIQNDHGR